MPQLRILLRELAPSVELVLTKQFGMLLSLQQRLYPRAWTAIPAQTAAEHSWLQAMPQ
jgi:hypothetical protein